MNMKIEIDIFSLIGLFCFNNITKKGINMLKKLLMLGGLVAILVFASCSSTLMTSRTTVGNTTTFTTYATSEEVAKSDLQSIVKKAKPKFGTPGKIYCAKGVKKEGSVMPDLWSCTVKLVK